MAARKQSATPRPTISLAFGLAFALGCGGERESMHEETTGGKSNSHPLVGGTQSNSGAGAGGAPFGSSSTTTAGTNASTMETDLCADLAPDRCVDDCFKDNYYAFAPACANGAWTCSSDRILASSCPQQSCGAMQDGCCDRTTGIRVLNLCGKDGFRGTCPDGTVESDRDWCIPESLGIGGCLVLEGQPCTGPALSCRDKVVTEVTCSCSTAASDPSLLIWRCNVFLGP